MDVIVRGVLVVDGTGQPPFEADVGISDDEIVAVADLGAKTAVMEIDGSGLVAAPGFIDMHSHSDFTLTVDPRSMSKVSQGVTTEVVGNCGVTPAPLAETYSQEWIESVGFLPGELSWDWRSFGDFLGRLRETGLGVNIFPLVGHGAIRTAVMGMVDEQPSPEQMEQMAHLLSASMLEGALGISTGLIYPPGVYSQTTELVQLTQVAGTQGGFYFSHVRGEGATLLGAIEEAVRVGRGGHLPVQVSHLKASGRANWDKYDEALGLIEGARAEGVDLGFDMYPYTAGNTVITALLPPWVMAGGLPETLARLQDSSLRDRIGQEILQQEMLSETGWEDLMIGGCARFPDYAGKSLATLSKQAGAPPLNWLLDFVVDCRGKADIIIFAQSEENVRKGLCHPMATIGTDGLGLATTGLLSEGCPHPRNFGTYPRILGHYVRDEKVLSLEDAVRKMTSAPAARLRLRDRGQVCPGYKADLVVFDPNTVDDIGEYGQPPRYPGGVEYVMVNGRLVVEKGEHTGNFPGVVLGRGSVSQASVRQFRDTQASPRSRIRRK